MFQGDAERALDLYSSVLKDFHVEKVERYGADEGVEEGSFKIANISFAGHELVIYDSPPIHKFTFTPSMSLIVDFETKEQLEDVFNKLSQDGEVMMPLDNYGFSKCYAWITDSFGVSWQLNLP